jgi:hypothetical protein
MLRENDCVADPVPSSALDSTRDERTGVTLANVELKLAWNLRGNATDAALAAAATRLFGFALPTQPNTSARSDDAALAVARPGVMAVRRRARSVGATVRRCAAGR